MAQGATRTQARRSWAKRFNELVDEFFQRQQLPGLRRPEGFQQWLGVAHEHGIWLPQAVEVVDAEIKQTAAEGGAGQSDKTSAPGSRRHNKSRHRKVSPSCILAGVALAALVEMAGYNNCVSCGSDVRDLGDTAGCDQAKSC